MVGTSNALSPFRRPESDGRILTHFDAEHNVSADAGRPATVHRPWLVRRRVGKGPALRARHAGAVAPANRLSATSRLSACRRRRSAHRLRRRGESGEDAASHGAAAWDARSRRRCNVGSPLPRRPGPSQGRRVSPCAAKAKASTGELAQLPGDTSHEQFAVARAEAEDAVRRGAKPATPPRPPDAGAHGGPDDRFSAVVWHLVMEAPPARMLYLAPVRAGHNPPTRPEEVGQTARTISRPASRASRPNPPHATRSSASMRLRDAQPRASMPGAHAGHQRRGRSVRCVGRPDDSLRE